MNQNNSNSMVSQAQQELKQKGFYTGRVDGIDGPETRTAIRRYQRAQNLGQTGTLNDATISSLGLNNMRRNQGEASRSAEEPQTETNSSNQEGNSSYSGQENNSPANLSSDTVRAAQRKLSQDGFYSGRVDGQMNQGTRAAIRQYQKQNNLTVTGRLTRETAQSLGISTSHGNFETSQGTPLEQLGKGIAEGAKTQHKNNANRERQENH